MADMAFLRRFTATLTREPRRLIPAQTKREPVHVYYTEAYVSAASDDRFTDAHLNDCNDPECECWVRSLA